jgi:hypothetical protein
MTLFEVAHLNASLPFYEQGFILVLPSSWFGWGLVVGDGCLTGPADGWVCWNGLWHLGTSPWSWARRCLVWSGEAYLSYSLAALSLMGFIASSCLHVAQYTVSLCRIIQRSSQVLRKVVPQPIQRSKLTSYFLPCSYKWTPSEPVLARLPQRSSTSTRPFTTRSCMSLVLLEHSGCLHSLHKVGPPSHDSSMTSHRASIHRYRRHLYMSS